MLQYYGMILTAIIAIGGLYLTFQDNRKGIREQSRLDKLPCFSLTTLNYDVRNPLFGVTIDKEINSKGQSVLNPKDHKKQYYYRERKVTAAILKIKDGKACITTQLTEEEKKLIINGGVAEQRMAKGMIGIVNKPMTYVPIIICNVGNGAALDFRIGFNKLIGGQLNMPQYLSSTSINMNEEFYLGFFAIHDVDENTGEYLLEISYRDIFGNYYKQKCKFNIEMDDGTCGTTMEVSFLQERTQVE